MPLTLAFDIGYASIGWCVLSSDKQPGSDPDFLGTGSVTFPTDDCLASTRRDLRRTRRHIRSTRQRIERLKRWLVHRGVLGRADLDKPGHPAPFLLAAAALQGHRTLDAWELWTVLRWYAHNRGYDGNTRWSNDEEDAGDTEKVLAANTLMAKHGTKTMCETVCKCLELDPAKSHLRISSTLPYKTLNAAYPRKTVEAEVRELLNKHLGQIPGLDGEAVRLILKGSELAQSERDHLEAAGIKLPKRYMGGLLFGQLVPRFDNRIIARCPITWARTYDEAISAGNPDAEARKLADKFAKVPAAKCKEFLEYRLARILANIKAGGEPLNKELRAELWLLAEKQGRLTHADIKNAIEAHHGKVPTNIEAYFKLHPDSEKAMVLDPVMDEVRKAEGSRAKISTVWKQLPEAVKEAAIGQWRAGKGTSYAWMLAQCEGAAQAAIEDAMKKDFSSLKPKRGEPPYASFDAYLLAAKVAPEIPTGRAPYARPVLRQVVEEVKNGWDATKANRATDPENGEDKPANGVLYELGIPSSRVRQLQAERPLEKLTNNHLVRHRLLILDRLMDDILEVFTTNGETVERVVVEVARELREFSGMTAKKIAAELNSRLKDFKGAVAYLERAQEEIPEIEINGSIIRKCRIAMDLNWHCPYTGKNYGPDSLKSLEREHIIPYATRNTNALHALVLTWPEVNRMKGKRTARQFILDDGGKQVPENEKLSILAIGNFDEFVERLDTKGHPDDARRKRARKALLATTDFEDKELGFTGGQLTQSSHLMKLAMDALKRKVPQAAIDPIPGPVTAEIRKSWKLTGTLSLACPEVIDAHGEVLPKNDIRSLTHLHHALDAATLALAAHYFPLQSRGQDQKGKIWQAMLKRRRTEEEKKFLLGLPGRIFSTYPRPRRDKDGNLFQETDVRLNDLPKQVKERLSRSLAECRVMQHLPADQSGAKAELTTWGVVAIEGEGEDARVKLRQRSTKVEDGKRIITLKPGEERAGKLLGLRPKDGTGKLKAINGAMIIGENYGLALDPAPAVIPFHDVPQRLAEIRAANGGKPVRILRNGMLIRLAGQGRRDGLWRINSIKASLKLDLSRPPIVGQPSKGEGAWREVSVAGLLKKGLEILPRRYTGYPIKG